MAPFISSSRGFVADIHALHIEHPKARNGRTAILVLVIGLIISAASLLYPVPERTNQSVNESASTPQTNNSYAFAVYTLNHTSSIRTVNGTAYLFNSSKLPLNFSRLQFGDYSSDRQYRLTYYAGSGILLNASGSNSSITLRASNGRIVGTVFYHGQSRIAFNGQTITYFNGTTSTVCKGTDLMVQDWRTGNWTPDRGIIIEHPSNVTLADAKFYLAVYHPSAGTEIPEFELIPTIAVIIAVMLIAAKRCRFAGRQRADSESAPVGPTEKAITDDPVSISRDEP